MLLAVDIFPDLLYVLFVQLIACVLICRWTPPVLLFREPAVYKPQDTGLCFLPRWVTQQPAFHAAEFLRNVNRGVQLRPLLNLLLRDVKFPVFAF